MNNKVLITRKIDEKAIEKIRDFADLELNIEDKKWNEDQIIDRIKDKTALLCLISDKINKNIIDNAPNLKVISNFGVGFNNIDVDYASEQGIMVCNTPGVLDHTTAELALALILSVNRRIVEADHFVRSNKWNTGWEIDLFQGFDLYGKTLGIIGLGRIASVLIQLVKGFNLKILYHNRNKLHPDFEKENNIEYAYLNRLLTESDIISIHTPLNSESKHLIGEKEISLMKESAVFINTARGEVVDEEALYEALKSKRIWGAGLDVFEREPQLTKGLTELDNVVILPHIGSATVNTRYKMAMMAADNLIEALNGKTPKHLVNKENIRKN